MVRLFLVVAVVLFQASVGNGAQITAPSCEAILAWAGQVRSNETYSIAPSLNLPKAFGDAQLVPLFGVPALDWGQEDLQAANQALVNCYQAAAKRRDRPAGEAFANANRTLQGVLPRVKAAVQKSRNDSEILKKQIDSLPDSPELGRALDALLKGNPAAPDANQFRPLPREVGDPVWRLAQAVMTLPNKDRESLYKGLGERSTSIQAGLAEKAEGAIAAAPEDATGVLGLMEVRQRLAGLTDPSARARLAKSADDKAQTTREALRRIRPAAWVPPSCLELYRWSSAQGAVGAVYFAGRSMMTAFLDERAVPVFGLSVAEWNDQDLASFKSLRGLCQAAVQQSATQANIDPSAGELVQLANRGRWIDTADQQVVDARTTVIAHRKAQEDLAAVLAKVQALPDAIASLPALMQLSTDPVLGTVAQEDRAKFANAINAKRASISARATEAAVKGLANVKVTSLADLAKLFSYAGQAVGTIPDPRGQQTFYAALERSVEEAAGRLLPEFQAKLAALPATIDGAGEANMAVAKLTGVSDASRVPAFKVYHDAALARSAAILTAVRAEACGELLSSLGVGRDAKQPVWDGHDGMALGDFICGLVERGASVDAYAGAGMFSSTSSLKVTPLSDSLQTVSLHKVEIKAGKPMLVGFQIRDANGQQRGLAAGLGSSSPDGKLSVHEWEMFATLARGNNPFEEEACKRLLNAAGKKPTPGEKLFFLHCVTLPGIKAALSR